MTCKCYTAKILITLQQKSHTLHGSTLIVFIETVHKTWAKSFGMAGHPLLFLGLELLFLEELTRV